MPIGDKNKETYKKVAEFFKDRAKKEWAKAKNGEGDYHYNNARENYKTAEKAKNSGKNK